MSEMTARISSRINELTREFNIITHNLANASTVGYKRRCNAFSKLLAAEGVGTGAEAAGKGDSKVSFDFSQGGLVGTGRSLDFALCGKGFFVVETPDGPLYTRNGLFRLDRNGQIVNSAGRIISGESGPVVVPPNVSLTQISVSGDGSVNANGEALGKFRLVDFGDNEDKLVAAGASCFRTLQGVTPKAAENLVVKQGFKETSNVQLVEELVDMVMVSRLYEANMKFILVKRDTSKSLMSVAMA